MATALIVWGVTVRKSRASAERLSAGGVPRRMVVPNGDYHGGGCGGLGCAVTAEIARKPATPGRQAGAAGQQRKSTCRSAPREAVDFLRRLIGNASSLVSFSNSSTTYRYFLFRKTRRCEDRLACAVRSFSSSMRPLRLLLLTTPDSVDLFTRAARCAVAERHRDPVPM